MTQKQLDYLHDMANAHARTLGETKGLAPNLRREITRALVTGAPLRLRPLNVIRTAVLESMATKYGHDIHLELEQVFHNPYEFYKKEAAFQAAQEAATKRMQKYRAAACAILDRAALDESADAKALGKELRALALQHPAA
jgi:hypothetical protein